MRQPTPIANTRNGLKWRDGRPRWEPSPANRKAGLRGCNLRDLDGRWITDRGLAISLCDLRTGWAALIREAQAGGPAGDAALQDLAEALAALPQPQEDAQRLRRLLVQDLIDVAQALVAGAAANSADYVRRGARTAERLLENYFDAVDRGQVKVEGRPLRASTRMAYWAQRHRFLARFAGRPVASITQRELKDWYEDELTADCSLSTANLCMAAVAAWLTWAAHEGWITVNPAHKLKLRKPDGRLMFWTLEEEESFTAWCDANRYEDVADAIVAALWTGARPIDLCAANLEQLAGDVWRFTPIKTERKNQEAMPAIMAPVRARVDRRMAAAAADTVRHLRGSTPFLWHPTMQRRHTVRSLRHRFKEAKAKALAAGAVPASLAEKRVQDTRDTCITRLWEAGITPARMWPWTGHSQESIERILRHHYLFLRERGMLELAEALETWATKERVRL